MFEEMQLVSTKPLKEFKINNAERKGRRMSNEEIIRILTRLKDQINFEWTDAQKKMDALNEAIKVVEDKRVEEQTGKWIDRSEGGRIKYPWWESHECSQCRRTGSGAWEYCPRCGAKMKEVE